MTPDEEIARGKAHVSSIRIQNFKCLEDVSFSIERRSEEQAPWTVLVGESGTGKTAVLEAVALALMGQADVEGLGLSADRFLARHETAGSVRIEVQGTSASVIRLTLLQGAGFDSVGGFASPTFVRGYGAVRLPQVMDPSGEQVQRSLARVDNLFDPRAPLCSAEQWLRSLAPRAFEAAARTLREVLPDGAVSLERTPEGVFVDLGEGRQLLGQLGRSDRAMFGLAADILCGLPFESAAELQNLEGLVLLDELGAQLDPVQHRTVAADLKRAFPGFQFIATASEPLCVADLEPEEIVVLSKEDGKTVAGRVSESFGQQRAEQILQSDLFRLTSQEAGRWTAPPPKRVGAGPVEKPFRLRPEITRTTHQLPFDKLDPLDFERLCLWLVRREGFENVEHLGQAGSEQGRDLVARRDGRRFAFQCKRVQRFTAADAEREIDKIRKLASKHPEEKPDEYVFVVTKGVRAQTRKLARKAWGDDETCHFWTGSELDERVKRHPDILAEFFAIRMEIPSGDEPPKYRDEESRRWSQKLESLYEEEERLQIEGMDTERVQKEILDVRQRLRQGPQLQAGDFLSNGRYLLIEKIGEGGFGTVWRARDRGERRQVAIKVLHGHYGEDRTRRDRFFRGARKMAELQHAGIVRVFEENLEDGGFHFFVMELLTGGNFKDAVLEGRLGPEAALRRVLKVGEALSFAHGRNLVHRDVKPNNILLDEDDAPYLTDFDWVQVRDSILLTLEESRIGTLGYAAPEILADARNATERSDVFSLAMTAIFAVSRRDPSLEESRDPLPLIAGLELPDSTKAVLRQALSTGAAERQCSVEEFCEELESSLEGGFTTEDDSEEGSWWTQHGRWILLAAALLAALVGILYYVGLNNAPSLDPSGEVSSGAGKSTPGDSPNVESPSVQPMPARALVYLNSPGEGGRTWVDFPLPRSSYPSFLQLPSPSSLNLSLGWIADRATQGNNAVAFRGNRRTEVLKGSVEDGRVTFEPEDPLGEDQWLLNAFYFCNYLHDFFALLGFGEAEGNFQHLNFTGAPGDRDELHIRVFGEPVMEIIRIRTRQDGRPNQLDLGPVDDRHSALDADAVFYGYALGVVKRLVGSGQVDEPMAPPQSRALVSGYAVYFSLTIQSHRLGEERTVFGEWLGNNTEVGLRRHSYGDDFPLDYGDLADAENQSPHTAGDIWCATLMRMNRRIGEALGDARRGHEIGWLLVMDSLKVLRAQPSFLDARDAIIRALDALKLEGALDATDHEAIERAMLGAFLHFGMGPGATGGDAAFWNIVADGADEVLSESVQVPVSGETEVVPGSEKSPLPLPFSTPRSRVTFRTVGKDGETAPGYEVLYVPVGLADEPSQYRVVTGLTTVTREIPMGAYSMWWHKDGVEGEKLMFNVVEQSMEITLVVDLQAQSGVVR